MLSANPSREEKKQQLIENHKADEKIHKMVVKIISWKAGILDGASITRQNKITPNEWNTYRKHILKISKTESKDRVMEKLKATQLAIKKNGGFK